MHSVFQELSYTISASEKEFTDEVNLTEMEKRFD